MSKVTNVTQTANQLKANYDVSKLFLGENDTRQAVYTAAADVTLENGLLVGKNATSGKIVAFDPSANDGSQYIFGVLHLGLNESVDILDAVSKTLTVVNKGRVAKSKITLPAGVLWTTAITGDGRTVEDYANSLGLILEGGTELTKTDN